jgi:topoisomerase-4 subunit A
MVKRFSVKGITWDKEYDLTRGAKGSNMLYFTANPNGEAEVVTVSLSSRSRAHIKVFDFDFSGLEIKGRGAGGNILTKYPVRKIQLKSEGKSTLGGVDIYYDEAIGRLNRDQTGKHLGNFNAEDSILTIYNDGSYEMTTFELTNRYESNQVKLIEKFNQENIITAIYLDGSSKNSYIKKFIVETTTINKKFLFISESKGSKLLYASSKSNIVVTMVVKKKRTELKLDELVGVKGWKAVGNKLSEAPITKIKEGSGEVQGYDKPDDNEENIAEASIEKMEQPATENINEQKKIKPDEQENKEPGQDLKERTVEAIQISDSEKDVDGKEDKKSKEEKHDEGFHSGDTIEMKIDMEQLKKKKDQLGLFDD